MKDLKYSIVVAIRTSQKVFYLLRKRHYFALTIFTAISFFVVVIGIMLVIFWFTTGFPPWYVRIYGIGNPVGYSGDDLFELPLFWVGSGGWVFYGTPHFILDTLPFAILIGVYVTLFYHVYKTKARTLHVQQVPAIALGTFGSIGAGSLPVIFSMGACSGAFAALAPSIVLFGIAISMETVTILSRVMIVIALGVLLFSIYRVSIKIEGAIYR